MLHIHSKSKRLKLLPLVATTALAVAMAGSSPAFAEEPHGAEAHKYEESIYNNGPVVTLGDAIQKALQASPRLKSAQAGLDAAKGVENQAAAWLNPELGFDVENVAGGGQFSGTDSAEYSYGISQTVEIGGKRPARQAAAKAMRKAAQTGVLAERLNLERDIHIAYSGLLANAEALKLAIDQERLAKGVLAAVSKRVDAAAEPEIQLSKAEVAYATSVIAREQKERQLRVAKEKLARLWGASTLDVSLDHGHFFDLQAADAFHAYLQKLDQVPDMRRLSFMQAEKQSLLDLQKAQMIPDPSFSLGVRDFRASGDQALFFGVSLSIPVFNQNNGNVARARAEVTQAESDARQAKLMLQQQLTENWQGWSAAYSEAERMQARLLPAAEKAFKLARIGYEKGKFPYLEVLDAQRTLFDARAQFHDALIRYHTSRANVERLASISRY